MRLRRLTALALVSLAVFGCARPQAVVSPPPPPATPAPVKPPPPPPPVAPLPPPPAPVPPVSVPAAPPPVIAPQLGHPEEERLRRAASARIEGAELLVKQVADRKLGTDQQETLATVQSFLVKARHALATQDLQQAFTLADKAEALAKDLVRTTR